MVKLALLLALVCGCEANLGGGNGGGDNTGVDASTGGGSNNPDAAVVQQMDAPAPACANGRKLFLNFDGVALTKGAPTDATINRVDWMANASATMPRYHDGVAGRATEITSIIDGVKARLSSYPIEVVTTRPSAGPYVMIVLGGTNTTIGTNYTYATSDHDCGDLVKSDVGWIGDAPPVAYVPDLVMGTIGWSVGLNGTNAPTGCMCGWANACNEDSAVACTLSSSIASTTSSGNTTCPNQNPQNEVAAFSTGFCQ